MNSMGSTPFARACSISDSRMAREEFAISTVPLIIEEMPVPEPPPVTATAMLGLMPL